MCGIIGYLGQKQALPILLDGLHRMEYRGYDSTGIATVENDQTIHVTKQPGKLNEFENALQPDHHKGSTGIAHIRWATHGTPNQTNAHPHTDCTNKIAIVHNGIIENHNTLRNELKKNNHTIVTDTDSELIAHLIEEAYQKTETLEESVGNAIKKISGTFGLVVLSRKEPDKIVGARLGSPLILGIVKQGEYIIASDVSAIIKHTRDVIYLEEDEIVTITPEGYSIKSHDHGNVAHPIHHVEWEIDQIEKNGYDHFMLKEIFEQPESLTNTMRGRVIADEGLAKLGGLNEIENKIKNIKRIIIVGMGTARYAGLLGEYWMEKIAGIPTEVELASEFRYRSFPVEKKEDIAILFISQSGETADSIAALREAKRRGFLTIGIINVVGSTIARETDAGIYNHAGPEIAVASTKAFTSQLVVLILIAIAIGRKHNLDPAFARSITEALLSIPDHIRSILAQSDAIKSIAKKYCRVEHMLFIGRKHSFPIALEGALKIKEVSYIHAEGYSAGELKHGPIALIDDSIPTIVVIPHDDVYEKTLSNLQEIRARNGKIIVITDNEQDEHLKGYADDIIEVPYIAEILSPLLTIIPLQLFAYYVAIERGLDVDKPRNLAKSVTVE